MCWIYGIRYVFIQEASISSLHLVLMHYYVICLLQLATDILPLCNSSCGTSILFMTCKLVIILLSIALYTTVIVSNCGLSKHPCPERYIAVAAIQGTIMEY